MGGLLYNKKDLPLASALIKSNSNHPKLQKILKQPLYYIFLLRLNDGRIALYERVNIFTLYQCTMVFELEMACSKYKMVDQLKENEIIFASKVDILIFDIVKGIIQTKIKMHSMPNESISTIMVLNSDNVLVGIDDSWGHNSSSTIRVLNLKRKEFIDLKKENKGVFCFERIDDDTFAIGFFREVHIWKY